jgi:hypothetical protein
MLKYVLVKSDTSSGDTRPKGELKMALRTFAKVFKTSYDLAAAISAVGESANLLAKLDADRRSTSVASSLGMSEGRFNLEKRRAASQYTKRHKRMEQLLRKFNKQDSELIERIVSIGRSSGRRGRPPKMEAGEQGNARKSSGRGGARPGAGRPKGSKNRRRGPGRPKGSKNK